MNTTYELLVLSKPDLDRESLDALLDKIQGQIEKSGGAIKNVDEWGIRKLAYPVKKHNDGHYVLYEYDAVGSETVRPIEAFLRLQAPVMRFKTTVKPEVTGPKQNADHPSFRDRR